ncbi:MAG TPA: protein kinase [Terriglobales bacterium]|nr:protein kinase [Terriglobales bacterium]
MKAGIALGRYEILAPCGSGGMGEVYKARDTRLDRIVAIKVSTEPFSARFEREARAIAALQHPHICTLYDVGENFLIMEYIEGSPVRGPVPVDQALKIAGEIADALVAAHQRHIIHRDLKPSNILLAKSGVKLLDFGLAKVDERMASGQDGATQALTQEGSIVGTLQYMAPEQVQGKSVDERSDIFSFGCVLYELITGRQAFKGNDAASIIAAVLREEPPPLSMTMVPSAPVERVVRKCLAKDPEERWQTARDLRDEIQWIASGGASSGAGAYSGAGRERERLAWVVAVTVLAAVSGFALLRPHPPGLPAHPASLPLALPEMSILSPDGEKLLVPEKNRLSIHDLTTAQSQPLNGTEGADRPFWYPDSRAIGFKAGNQLRKLDLATGLAGTLFEGPVFPWNFDGTGVLATEEGKGIIQIPPEGGTAKELMKLVPPYLTYLAAQPLPGGKRFLFFAVRGGNSPSEIRVGSVDGGAPVTLLTSDTAAVYAAPGYLLYLKGDTLMAQPFDASRAVLTGPAHPLMNRVGRVRDLAIPRVSISQTGLLLYVPGTRFRQTRLTWYDRSGKPAGTLGELGDYSNPALSPDGSRLAVSLRDPEIGTRDIWIFDLVRGGNTRFTFDAGDDFNAVWSPDSSRVAFTSLRNGVRDLYLKAASGAGHEELLYSSTVDKNAEDWSPDGTWLSFNVQPPGDVDLDLLSMNTPQHQARGFRNSPLRELNSAFSPDGKFLAYRSGDSGRTEVFVESLAPGRGRWQISSHGGDEPRWRRDGKELFFVSKDILMSVDIQIHGDALTAGIARELFQVPTPIGHRNSYIVTPDGQRFLVVVPEQVGSPAPQIVLNWPALLEKR